jgi:hypothetical protein
MPGAATRSAYAARIQSIGNLRQRRQACSLHLTAANASAASLPAAAPFLAAPGSCDWIKNHQDVQATLPKVIEARLAGAVFNQRLNGEELFDSRDQFFQCLARRRAYRLSTLHSRHGAEVTAPPPPAHTPCPSLSVNGAPVTLGRPTFLSVTLTWTARHPTGRSSLCRQSATAATAAAPGPRYRFNRDSATPRTPYARPVARRTRPAITS